MLSRYLESIFIISVLCNNYEVTYLLFSSLRIVVLIVSMCILLVDNVSLSQLVLMSCYKMTLKLRSMIHGIEFRYQRKV